MDRAQIVGLSEGGLKARIEWLISEGEVLEKWRQYSTSPFGEFLLSHKKQELERIRALYGSLDLSGSAATLQIARIQGAEEQIVADIDRLTRNDEQKKALDAEADLCMVVLREKQKRRYETPSSIVAEGTKENRDG